MSKVINGVTIYGDHEDWTEARSGQNAGCIKLAENIEVSGGTVKLKLYHDTHTWTCTSCSNPQVFTKNYTGPDLALPYLKTAPGYIQPNWFNSGRFEARLKQPIAEHSYSTWWLWNGGGINEIDITEAVGDDNKFWRENKINTHAFKPPFGQPNPYNLPNDASSGTFKYPSQSNWDILWNTSARHRQEDWHTYTCEWDSTQIRFYIDGGHVRTLYRFWRWLGLLRVAAQCSPFPGQYYTTYGFPYNDASSSNLRFGITSRDDPGTPTSGRTFIDQTEIDYVRIWQRHPERDGHTEWCSGQNLTVSGPSTVYGGTNYTISVPQSGGTWSLSNDAFSMSSASQNGATLTINPASTNTSSILTYTYQPAGCSNAATYTKVITSGVPNSPYVQVLRSTFSNNTQRFFLSTASLPGHTYQWHVNWSISNQFTALPLNYAGSFSGTGPTVASQYISQYSTLAYSLDYTLTVTNACGTKEYHGYKFNVNGQRLKPHVEDVEEHSMQVAETMLTSLDSERYEGTVLAAMQEFIFPDTVTDKDVAEHELRVRYDLLFPYLVEEEMPVEEDPGIGGRAAAALLGSDSSQFYPSQVYPNPSVDEVSVRAGSQFNLGEPVSLKVMDMTGRIMKRDEIPVNATHKFLSTTDLPDATFILLLEQGSIRNVLRFVKLAKR